MGWRVWGEPLYTSHFGSVPSFSQDIKINTEYNNFVLRGLKTWVVFFNNPVFTSLEMRIYSRRSTSPEKLLHTSSNTLGLSDITSYAYAAREIYFNFDTLPNLDKDDHYMFAIWANGYTGNSGSHIAWKKAYPDSAYAVVGASLDVIKLGVWPFDIFLIGDEL